MRLCCRVPRLDRIVKRRHEQAVRQTMRPALPRQKVCTAARQPHHELLPPRSAQPCSRLALPVHALLRSTCTSLGTSTRSTAFAATRGALSTSARTAPAPTLRTRQALVTPRKVGDERAASTLDVQKECSMFKLPSVGTVVWVNTRLPLKGGRGCIDESAGRLGASRRKPHAATRQAG